MKTMLFVEDKTETEFLDPTNNIERMRRLQSINFRRVMTKGERGVSNMLSHNNKRITFRYW